MHPPSRARRILKWTSAGLSSLIIAGWIVGRWWFLFLVLPGNPHFVSSGAGFVELIATQYYAPIRVSNGFHYHGAVEWGLAFPQFGAPRSLYGDELSIVEIPFWLILLLTAIPTAWLWHRDRWRIRPWHCPRCGYDLTDNTSGVCPECGDKVCLPAELRFATLNSNSPIG